MGLTFAGRRAEGSRGPAGFVACGWLALKFALLPAGTEVAVPGRNGGALGAAAARREVRGTGSALTLFREFLPALALAAAVGLGTVFYYVGDSSADHGD